MSPRLRRLPLLTSLAVTGCGLFALATAPFTDRWALLITHSMWVGIGVGSWWSWYLTARRCDRLLRLNDAMARISEDARDSERYWMEKARQWAKLADFLAGQLNTLRPPSGQAEPGRWHVVSERTAPAATAPPPAALPGATPKPTTDSQPE